MSRRWPLWLALLLLAGPLRAFPPAPVVQKASASVYRILARSCKAHGREVADHLATGFSVQVDGAARLVTALHAVAGCALVEIQYQGQPYDTQAVRVLRAADLVQLSPAPGLDVPALPFAAAVPSPGSECDAIGYGSTPTALSKHAPVRAVGAGNISGLVQDPKMLQALGAQGFPSLQEAILNIDGPLTPGDSGAPLINGTGELVGVVNGNLMRGTSPISWAFPALQIRKLITSTEKKPEEAQLSDLLVAEELPPATPMECTGEGCADGAAGGVHSRRPLPPPKQRSAVRCGARTFQFRGSQTFDRMVATADDFARSHLVTVEQYAVANQLPIDRGARFDVWVDSGSGASFVVPEAFTLTPGSDCLASDPEQQVEMRVHTDGNLTFPQTTAASLPFVQRLARPGESYLVNPNYSTGVVSRPDGMAIQRWAYWYAEPGQMMPPFNESYLTLVFRKNTLLLASLRTFSPGLALQGNQSVFPAVAAVYAASFQLQ